MAALGSGSPKSSTPEPGDPEDCTQYILFLRFWWHHAASMTAPFGSLVSADPKELWVFFS